MSGKIPQIYAGGSIGMETMMDACASRSFRFHGGGFCIHGMGWGTLSDGQRDKVAKASEGCPICIEIGMGNGRPHDRNIAQRFVTRFQHHNINPSFIMSDAFAESIIKRTTPERWRQFTAAIRETGYKGPVYPIFEYANKRKNWPNVGKNLISHRKDWQEIIKFSKGMAIDSAVRFFFQRDESYRKWITQAIQICRISNNKSTLILSPFDTDDQYEESVVKVLDFLEKNNAVPDNLIIENYHNFHPDREYIPTVGREWIEDTCLGVAWRLYNNYYLKKAR